jgi:hypothetical protein
MTLNPHSVDAKSNVNGPLLVLGLDSMLGD